MTTPCHRARSLVSQALDGSLHELEQHFVTAHLARCGVCRAFQEDTEAFTALLREAPLEPVPWPVTSQARASRKRVHFRTIAQIASVASVVVAAGTIALAHERPGGSADTSVVAPQGINPVLGDESIRSLRREALTEGELQILPVSSTTPAEPVKPALPITG